MMAGCGLMALVLLCGTRGLALDAQQRVPLGVIPGAPAGSPDQAPDTSNFDYQIITRGPMMLQLLNGQSMSVLVDDDAAHRALEGVLGLQMHVGDPFRVEFRNIWYKRLQDK
jgi:hypothetical protein